jgi:cytochrome c oxidase subunit II
MRIVANRGRMRTLLVLAAVAFAALLSLDVAHAQLGVPRPITDEAREIRNLYLIVLAMGTLVFIGVEAALIYILIRFRRKSDVLPPQTHGNNVLEIIWTTIPIIIVLGLFVATFVTLLSIENEADEEDLTIEVNGFQFQWEFTYSLDDLGRGTAPPDAEGTFSIIGTAAAEPTLVIPVDEPVEFRLRADDVIHSFYIRDFLYKLDLIPGRDNRFVVTARETGTYIGQCAELCGVGHAIMRFTLEVVTREEFDQWVAEQAGGNNAVARQP